MKDYETVAAYIKSVPKEHRAKLTEMRSLLKELVPEATEAIRYGMPTLQLYGRNFVHYAAMKGHLGFYPSPSGIQPFEAQLTKQGISFSKGCIRFQYTTPLPVTLITKIVKHRLKEEAAAKK